MPCSQHHVDSSPRATKHTSSAKSPPPQCRSQPLNLEGTIAHYSSSTFTSWGRGRSQGLCPLQQAEAGPLFCQGRIHTKTYRDFHKASSLDYINVCLPCPAVCFKPSTNAVLQQINASIDQAFIWRKGCSSAFTSLNKPINFTPVKGTSHACGHVQARQYLCKESRESTDPYSSTWPYASDEK